MPHSRNKTNFCNCFTECLGKTNKATHLTNTTPTFFSAKERQFLLLMSNDDVISSKARALLLNKVSIKNMMDLGLLKKNEDCMNYQHLLMKHTKSSESTTTTCKPVQQDPLFEEITDQLQPTVFLDPILELLAGNATPMT